MQIIFLGPRHRRRRLLAKAEEVEALYPVLQQRRLRRARRPHARYRICQSRERARGQVSDLGLGERRRVATQELFTGGQAVPGHEGRAAAASPGRGWSRRRLKAEGDFVVPKVTTPSSTEVGG